MYRYCMIIYNIMYFATDISTLIAKSLKIVFYAFENEPRKMFDIYMKPYFVCNF